MQMLLPTKLRQSFLRWLALGLLTSLLSACGYNEIQVKDEAVKAAWSEVVNQYQRRADLVPNLVNTVKGYAAHEQSTLTEVINARAKATSITVTPDLSERHISSSTSRVSADEPSLRAPSSTRRRTSS